jgi:hypothetical protein
MTSGGFSESVEAGEIGHHDIEQNYVIVCLAQNLQRFFPAGYGDGVKLSARQLIGNQLAQEVVVVDD